MKKMLFALFCVGFCLAPLLAGAEIFYWTDENGVKHFSNEPPPEKILNPDKVPEAAHDEAADERRMVEDQKWREDQEKRTRKIEAEQAARNKEKEEAARQLEAEKQKEAEKLLLEKQQEAAQRPVKRKRKYK
jgi:hypothetical protein